MTRRALPLALAVTLAAAAAAVAAQPPRIAPRPTVVVAVADSGINPYHQAFYRPGNTRHPCTYVAGFSCSVPALPLSIGKYQDYAQAVEADKRVWAGVEAHRWYWIPKTNIIGAVCDTATSLAQTAEGPGTCILDDNGHGTATASSVLSEAPDALLLVHEGNAGAYDLATAPVLPDVQSHSWGPPAPLPLHAADLALQDTSDACGAERKPESLFFLAAGNEAPWPTFLDCERAEPDVHVVGGGYPGYWTAASWSMFDFASYFCRPAAEHTSVTATERHCGTSFSAPTVAGATAAALLRLRRQDGYTGRSTLQKVSRTVTRAAFEKALRDAATYRPKTKYPTATVCPAPGAPCVVGGVVNTFLPLPEQAPWLFWGYGWLDSTVTDAVVSCARGRACPKKPAEAQQWHDTRLRARTVFQHGLVSPSPQQDAGTKRDAGEDRKTAIGIAPGREYAGTLEPYLTGGDQQDWYTFRAVAGQKVSVKGSASLHPSVPADVAPAVGCWWLVSPDGRSMDTDRPPMALWNGECDSASVNEPPRDVEAPATGTYALVYAAHQGLPRHDYRFTVTVGR